MRLWHQAMIPTLSGKHLLGQHRECCALRGKGWGRKHATVDYVFTHPYEWLVVYHWKIMDEMIDRGYEPNEDWVAAEYRGKKLGWVDIDRSKLRICNGEHIYPEHDDAYLEECKNNLKKKGY